MRIIISHPVKAYLQDFTPEQIADVRKQLTYKNQKIVYQIGKVRGLRWLKRKDPMAWQARIDELKAQIFETIVFKDSFGVYVRPGSIPYLNLNVPVENTVKYPGFKPMSWKKAPEFEPYQYQLDAERELLKIRHGNVSLATGLGKSHILLMLVKAAGLRAVIVTPSKSIFNELLTEFQLRLGKLKVGGYGDGKKDIKKPITIAIGKSITMLKEGTDAHKFFTDKQVMLVDESHVFGSEQLEKVCHDVLGDIPYRFFVSATQTRGDGTKELLQSVIGKTVVEKTIKQGIEEGFLCRLRFKVLPVFSPSTKEKKDPVECKREHLLRNPEIAKKAAQIANASWLVKQESTLILVEELSQIEKLSKLLTVPFGYVHSSSKREAAEYGLEKVVLQEQVDMFNRGEVPVLVGTRAIATGTNLFPTHNTVNWMCGSSEIITKQGPMGRSTRKLEISKYVSFHKPKLYTMIYDFDVTGQTILKRQLDKRVQFYEETGEEVEFF